MSHGIMEHDNAFYGNREPAWHRLGTVIDQDVVTSGEAIRLAGLDWTVEQHGIHVHISNGDDLPETTTRIDNKVANVRMDTGEALGIVTPHYKIIQNVDAFDFFDEIIGKGDAHYHTAGSLYNGRKIWALARLNRDIMIGGDPDERIDPFVTLCNGHDGNTALSVYTTPIRVVCQNTLQWSMQGCKNMWKGRHTPNVTDKVRDARDMLGFSNDYFDALQALGDMLITQPITATSFVSMLDSLVPVPVRTEDESQRSVTIAENTREAIYQAWNVDNLANVKFTKWGFVQAVAEYVDWSKNHRSDDKFIDQNLLGANQYATLKDRSVQVAVNA
ncbi:LGT_TIGR03299, phage/plasmid-like protein TIGR03299 [uncultured Caudovirales phage]|uniref:LGT_TIGR03299, phage/plasmid-like protein TIGR03299 n=1 Tax=uncultured Caudovirales phage TaxID=2100421 RepID=A0A6J5PXP9_9CAUD|nr:LGT_TIGR03299, phage/plasmid-like protein TIGR03299 [uncultured Caudovirales phage]